MGTKNKKGRRLIPLIVFLIILGLVLSTLQILAAGKILSDYSNAPNTSGRSSGRHNRSDEEDDDDEDIEDEDIAEWTVLVYMCGTDLETQGGFASLAFDWMDDEEITDDINVIVETGGTLHWNNDDPYFASDSVHDVDIPDDMLGRFKIEQGEIIELDAAELQSMGSADTLADFISWGVSEYPARKYMFVMWDHGYAEPYGNMEHDEIFYDNGAGGTINSLDSYVDESLYFNDCLTLDEIREAFDGGGAHFDLIAFNTCLSASLEVASAVAPYGD